MPSKEERDRIIQEIVRILYDNKAYTWTVQDKGVLVAAVKLQLSENTRSEREAQ